MDNSCALCGERQKENLTKHHIDGDKTNNSYDNQIVICWNCHQRHNQKKGISIKNIKERKKTLIQKILTQYGVNVLKMTYRKNAAIGAMPFLLFHLVDMGYMKQKDVIMSIEAEDIATFEITDRGRALYEKWFK